MTERAAPFYCPYCGDEDLRPFGERHGDWRCGACQRVFRLGYVGLSADWTSPVGRPPGDDESEVGLAQ
jgi:ribosomal protein L37AE/L43A